MDLLLHLVRVHEVDIHDIPVALIAERYMAAIADLSTIDIDTAGEFLVMAATLAEIKSRVVAAENLSPEDAERAKRENAREEKEAEDPRAELLLEYKRLRERADALEQRLETWQSRARVAPALRPTRDADDDTELTLDLEDLTLGDLVEAFEHIASTIQFDRLGEHQVTDDATPIELHQADAVYRLERAQADTGKAELPLRDLFNGRTRPEAIGMFLAILELVRNLRVRAWRAEATDHQPDAIWLGLVESAPED